jgi:hypothetical protein
VAAIAKMPSAKISSPEVSTVLEAISQDAAGEKPSGLNPKARSGWWPTARAALLSPVLR